MKATKILKVTAYAELGIGIITAIFTLVENSHVSQYQLDRGEDIPFSRICHAYGHCICNFNCICIHHGCSPKR
jgi:hypothetical protein